MSIFKTTFLLAGKIIFVPHFQQRSFNFHLPGKVPVNVSQPARELSHKLNTQCKSLTWERGSRVTKTLSMERGVCVRNSASSKRANFNPGKWPRLRLGVKLVLVSDDEFSRWQNITGGSGAHITRDRSVAHHVWKRIKLLDFVHTIISWKQAITVIISPVKLVQ